MISIDQRRDMESIAFAAAETRRSAHFEQLTNKIKTKTARVGVVGLGYVGLPLAVEYASEGYSVTGIDLQASKVDQINNGVSYIQDVPTSVVAPAVAAKKLRATTDFSVVAELDTINICVPTPLRKTKDPDMSYIVSACRGNRQVRSSGNAGDSGIDHLSRHHR